MIFGRAIKPNIEEGARYIAPPGAINNDTLEIIEVYKCPKCGHSEFIED